MGAVGFRFVIEMIGALGSFSIDVVTAIGHLVLGGGG